MKFVCLLLFSLLTVVKVYCSGANEPLECMIYNEEYKGEYLYALYGINVARRSVYTWSPLFVKELSNPMHENCTNVFNDQDKQGIWLFEPVDESNLTFTVKNLEYGEYLYATSLHSSFFNSRRKVFTWLYTTELDDSFKWRIKPLADNRYKYELWNVKFDEPLYAASYFFRYDNLRRNVFTWNKKQPDSKQFNWFVKCRNDRLLTDVRPKSVIY